MEHEAPRADLRGVLAALRRRRWIVASTAAVALALGLLYVLLAEPVYEARAEVLVEPDVPMSDPDLTGRVFFLDQELATQLELITSDVVLRRAAEALELPIEATDGVSAELLTGTRIIWVTVRDADPQRAADLAQATAEEYLGLRLEEATARLVAGRDELQRQLDEHRADVTRLDAALEASGGLDPVLRDERQTAIELVNWTGAQLAQLEAGLQSRTGGGRIIEPAVAPERPAEPALARTAVVALVVGLGLGLVLALVRDVLDEAVRSDEDVLAATGRPILGRVPRFTSEVEGVVLLQSPSSPEAEAYRDLRTNLRFAGGDLRAVAVTSSVDGEGKSSVAANLAVAASLAGFDVALVDADLRRPTLHRLFGVANGVGLSEVLAATHGVGEVGASFDDPPLRLITAGRLPPNPSELLGSQQLAELIADLTARHDLVILDTPPALAASDALEAASVVDATIVVVENERAGRRAVHETVGRLDRAGGRVVGAVINRIDPKHLEYGYYQRD